MGPLRIGFVGTIGVLLAYGLSRAVIEARSTLILVVVAFVIALGLNPAVEWLQRRKVKRSLAVPIVFLGVLAAAALALFAIVPVLSEQVSTLASQAPSLLERTLANPQVAELNERYQVISKAQEYVSSGGLLQRLFGGLVGAGALVLGGVLSTVTVLILTLYFLASMPALKSAIHRLSPASKRARVADLEEQAFRSVSAYIVGTFIVALIAAVTTFIFLMIVGLREYALALAVLVGVLDVIPLIGATIAAVVVVLIAFIESPTIGLVALGYYLLYQQLENYVIQPRVFKSTVDVPGAVVVIGALIGGALLGVIGALLAVPVAAAILLVLREVIQPRLDRA